MGRREEPLLARQGDNDGKLAFRELGKDNRHAIEADPWRRPPRLADRGRQEKDGARVHRIDGDPAPEAEAVLDGADRFERFARRQLPRCASSRPPPPHPGPLVARFCHVDRPRRPKNAPRDRETPPVFPRRPKNGGFPPLEAAETRKAGKSGPKRHRKRSKWAILLEVALCRAAGPVPTPRGT